MPGLDRTGPQGKGSGTGRGLGKCNPENNMQENDQPGRGMRWRDRFGRKSQGGRGLGRGMGNGRRFGKD
jgi:hypothetical protein